MSEVQKIENEKLEVIIANIKLGFLVALDISVGLMNGLSRIPSIAANNIFQAFKKVIEALNKI